MNALFAVAVAADCALITEKNGPLNFTGGPSNNCHGNIIIISVIGGGMQLIRMWITPNAAGRGTMQVAYNLRNAVALEGHLYKIDAKEILYGLINKFHF